MFLHYVYKQQLTFILLFLKDQTIIKLQLLITKMLIYTYFFGTNGVMFVGQVLEILKIT
jgi:hypothetical protein